MAIFGLLLLIAALAIGVSLFGFTISLVYYLVSGLVVGALARLVLPGREQIGLLGTALVGIGGSMLGGVAGRMLHAGTILELVLSVVAAAILLTAFGFRAKNEG